VLSSHTHERVVCSCGTLISQCRCFGPKRDTVRQNGCAVCAARQTAVTPEPTVNTPLATIAGAFDAAHDFPLESHLISLQRNGSYAYNLLTPESDEDYFGVVVPPARHIIGLGQFEHWEPTKGTLPSPVDAKVVSVAKFVRLLLLGNPNALELLFLARECAITEHRYFAWLKYGRERFLSKRAFRAIAGYAQGQVKKMTAGKTAGYMGRERKELVQQIGYDPKDASRLIHLLIMGRRLASEGTLYPRVSGYTRDTLLEIKRGEWPLVMVQEYAASLFEQAEQDFACTHLPDEPDAKWAEQTLIEIHRAALREHNA
jgi:hypothetical protein